MNVHADDGAAGGARRRAAPRSTARAVRRSRPSRGVSIEIAAAEWTAVMGPSGLGQVHAPALLAGLDSPTAGQVFIGDVDLTTLNDKRLTQLRREKVGFVFQAYNLIPTLTAEENITLPLDLAGQSRRPSLVGHGHRHRRHPAIGSGTGRASCPAASSSAWPAPARSSSRPEIVFADEPTGNLDSKSRRRAAGLHARGGRRARPDDRDGDPRPDRRRLRRTRRLPADGSIVDEMRAPTADRSLDRMKSLGPEPPCGARRSRACWRTSCAWGSRRSPSCWASPSSPARSS